MSLISAWIRQTARGAGASLAIPVVILVAAGAIALSGGGLGGIGALGQVATGPELPDTGVAPLAAEGDLAEEEIAALATVGVGGATGGGEAAAPAAGAAAPPTPGGSPGGPAPGPVAPGPTPPTGGGGGPTPPSSGGAPGGGGGGNPPPPPGPVQQIVDTTKGVTEPLPQPVKDITDPVIDGLLGPP